MADDRHARISEHAYRLWQQEGEPHGRDQAHWDEAERAFAGEGPVADEPDPQASDPQGATVADEPTTGSAPFSAPEQPVSEAASPACKPAPAKKPAARRKRTT